MKSNIFALIVIYNKNCNDSISYCCLKNIKGLNIIVCDNSISDYRNKDIVSADDNIYINMEGNKGLSKAYNKAITHLKNEIGVVCLFDDDTEIPVEYFNELRSLIKNQEWDICLPKVYYEKGMMSPVQLKRYAVKKVNKVEEINTKYIAGINSGMVVKLTLYENYKYDENLFLDFVDYKFIMDMRKKNVKIIVMKTKLKQLFSKDDNDKNSSKIRYNIKKTDLKYFYRSNFVSKLYCTYLLMKLKVGLVIKFKDLKVLGW